MLCPGRFCPPPLKPTAVALLLLAFTCSPVYAASGRLVLSVVDRETRKPLYCRMHLRGPGDRPRRPDRVPFWHDHFVVPGEITLQLPLGQYTFVLERGPEYLVREGNFTINPFADDSKQVDMKRFIDMAEAGWYSGDLYVRRPVLEIEPLMLADDLHLAEIITWGNDRGDRQSLPPQLQKQPVAVFDGNRCYRVGNGRVVHSGNELLVLGTSGAIPSAESESRDWPTLLEPLAHSEDSWVDLTAPFWWDLPALVAHEEVDSIELAHRHFGREAIIDNEADGRPRDRARYPRAWGSGQWSHHVYFQLLEAGLRIAPTAGSGSGLAPNPIGYNRIYAYVGDDFSHQAWWDAVRAGRVVVTNGPLLQPIVHGERPGATFHAESGSAEFEIGLTLSTRERISYLEIIQNGTVAHSIRFEEYSKSGRLPKLKFDRSGWFLVRAVTDLNQTFRFGMTGPYFVQIGYEQRVSRKACQFFLDWIDQREKQVEAAGGKQLRWLQEAREFWQRRAEQATVE